jgi:hypothetical protein
MVLRAHKHKPTGLTVYLDPETGHEWLGPFIHKRTRQKVCRCIWCGAYGHPLSGFRVLYEGPVCPNLAHLDQSNLPGRECSDPRDRNKPSGQLELLEE